jgi:hypothetical protein
MVERRSRRRRWTIGSLLVLVALAAIGLAVGRRVSEWWAIRRVHPEMATASALVLGSSTSCNACHAAPIRPMEPARPLGLPLGQFAARAAGHETCPAGTNAAVDCRSCHGR